MKMTAASNTDTRYQFPRRDRRDDHDADGHPPPRATAGDARGDVRQSHDRGRPETASRGGHRPTTETLTGLKVEVEDSWAEDRVDDQALLWSRKLRLTPTGPPCGEGGMGPQKLRVRLLGNLEHKRFRETAARLPRRGMDPPSSRCTGTRTPTTPTTEGSGTSSTPVQAGTTPTRSSTDCMTGRHRCARRYSGAERRTTRTHPTRSEARSDNRAMHLLRNIPPRDERPARDPGDGRQAPAVSGAAAATTGAPGPHGDPGGSPNSRAARCTSRAGARHSSAAG